MAIILVCDDMQTDRECIGRVVEAAGHTPQYARDGEEAFQLAQQIRPRLILMDVVMPRENGFSTCRKLKKDPSTSGIPVVLVTSKTSSTDKFWGEKQGADGYITKPFTAEQVLTAIKRHV